MSNDEKDEVQRCTAESVDTGTNGVEPGAGHSTDTADAGAGASQPFPPTYQEFRQQLLNGNGMPVPPFEYYLHDKDPNGVCKMCGWGCSLDDPVPLPKELQPAKQGYLIKVTNEDLENAEVFPVSWDQIHPISRQTRLAEAKARIAGTTARLALAHPALHPVIELHSPDEYECCMGCDGGPDYSGEWPCRTIELILEGLE